MISSCFQSAISKSYRVQTIISFLLMSWENFMRNGKIRKFLSYSSQSSSRRLESWDKSDVKVIGCFNDSIGSSFLHGLLVRWNQSRQTQKLSTYAQTALSKLSFLLWSHASSSIERSTSSASGSDFSKLSNWNVSNDRLHKIASCFLSSITLKGSRINTKMSLKTVRFSPANRIQGYSQRVWAVQLGILQMVLWSIIF